MKLKHLKLFLVFFVSISFVYAKDIASGVIIESEAPKTVNNFDIDRYMGSWYEIARLPTYFAKRCLAPIIADYKHVDDEILVTNSCATIAGDKQVSHTVIYLTEENLKGDGRFTSTSMPSWLRWTHLGRNDYWLLYTDYLYAMVGTPDHKYLWIYSRQENPPLKDIQNLIIMAQKKGYDVSGLIFNYPSYFLPE